MFVSYRIVSFRHCHTPTIGIHTHTHRRFCLGCGMLFGIAHVCDWLKQRHSCCYGKNSMVAFVVRRLHYRCVVRAFHTHRTLERLLKKRQHTREEAKREKGKILWRKKKYDCEHFTYKTTISADRNSVVRESFTRTYAIAAAANAPSFFSSLYFRNNARINNIYFYRVGISSINEWKRVFN